MMPRANRRLGQFSASGGWLLALIFPIGYLATFTSFTEYPFEYFVLTVLSLACLGLLLPVLLSRPLRSVLPVWLALTIFLGAYYCEFYLAVIHPGILDYFPAIPVSTTPTPEVYLSGYIAITLGFVAFCCTAWLYYSTRPRRWWTAIQRSFAEPEGQAPAINARALIWSALALVALNSMVVVQFNMIMGYPREAPLPGHFQGFVTYIQLLVVPAMMLGVACAGVSSKRTRLRNLGVAMLVGYALWNTVLIATKGAIVTNLMLLLFLWLVMGLRLGKREVSGAAALLLAAVLAFPFVAAFRALRAIGYTMTDALRPSTLVRAMAYAPGASTSVSAILWQEALRVTGGGVLLALIERRAVPMGLRTFASYLTLDITFTSSYLTVDVFGGPPESFYSFHLVPSMVGFFYLIAGNLGVVCGVALFTVGALAMWFWLGTLRLRTAAVARILWLYLLFGAMTEGPMDQELFKILPTFLVVVMLTEWLARRPTGRRRRYRTVPASGRLSFPPQGLL
ncbi:MAG: hypothetical protein WA005_16540 [Candidatus Binataceae bacterium]